MPHCIIEHSDDLDDQQLINAVFEGTLASGLFEEHDIKTRSQAFIHYQSARSRQSFVHVSAKLLDGRTLQQRAKLSQAILAQLQQLHLSAVSLTVEVLEIETASYAKVVLG
ncbi:MAG: hypothetical protein OFPI_13490 [Osedax symbiont Rs2]|nr:MAG: hypothetical protein OFPI_13490 [Osedax symbiont Rs2]